MNLEQAQSEDEARRRRSRRAKRVEAPQFEFGFTGDAFSLASQSQAKTTFEPPVTPERAAELFNNLRNIAEAFARLPDSV